MEVKASPVWQEGSELGFAGVSKAQRSTSCYRFLGESHVGTEDTEGTVCDTSGSTGCSPSLFLFHSQLFSHSHLSFLSFRKRWSESNH